MPRSSLAVLIVGEAFRSSKCENASSCLSNRSAQGTRSTTDDAIGPQLAAFDSVRDMVLIPLSAAGWKLRVGFEIVTGTMARAALTV